MARVTIIDLFNRKSEAQAKREALEAEAKTLQNKALEYACAAQQAAENGDTDKYLQCKQNADRANAEAYVKGAMRGKLNESFSRSEVVTAWNNYIADYSKQFDGMVQKYNKACIDLKKMFVDLLEMQRQALKWRRYAGDLIDVKPATIGADDVYSMFKMPFIPEGPNGLSGKPAVVNFLFGDEGYEKLQQISAIVKFHTTSIV